MSEKKTKRRNNVRRLPVPLNEMGANIAEEVRKFIMRKYQAWPAAEVEKVLPTRILLSDGRIAMIHGKCPKNGSMYEIGLFVELLTDA